MLTINKYPRCKGYLAAMWIKEPYTGMTDYWCAVCIADSFSDEYLASVGTVDFSKMTGAHLLAAFEGILERKSQKQKTKTVKQVKRVGKLSGITAAVSPEEIKAARTPKGAWKAKTLAQWGISWPPPQGWRKQLIENYNKAHV